jgi:hypothetical protein
MGHEERFPRRRLSGRCGFRKQSVAVDDQATQAFGIRGRHKTRSKKQLEELPRGWLELSGYCPRIALLPLSLLIEKHGGGLGSFLP